MSEGFKGFSNNYEGKKLYLRIQKEAVNSISKEYKKLKKYQKSSFFEIEKLTGKETKIDKLINEYGIDSEAIE